jgi:hypothetical protein
LDINFIIIFILEGVIISVEFVLLFIMINHINKLRDYTMRLEKSVDDIDNRVTDIGNKISTSHTE